MRVLEGPCQEYGRQLGVHRLDLCQERIMWSIGGFLWDQRRCEMHDGSGGAVALDICYYVLLYWVLLRRQENGLEEERQRGASWNVG